MLEAVNLSGMLGGRRVVQEVTLAVAPGEFLAMVGPNGAGKSTLLRLLSGFLQPFDGEARLDGRPVRAWPRRTLAARRAVLPQSCIVTVPFTVEQTVELGRSGLPPPRSAEQDDAAVRAAMRAADVAHLARRPITALSGGEQQRVHLARVLAQIWPDPEARGAGQARYLLLDEPTASLDIAHQHLLLGTARALSRAGLGVLAILHDLNLAALYADRLCLLQAGRVVAVERPTDGLDVARIAQVFGHSMTLLRSPDDGRPVVLPQQLNPVLPGTADEAGRAF